MTATATIADKIYPADLLQTAMARPRSGFALLYGDTQLLMVRLPDGSADLAEGLTTTVPKGNGGTAIKPSLPTIEYHTQLASAAAIAAMAPPKLRATFNSVALHDMLTACAHFVVPLRKRVEADTLSVDRITFGRARNKDIVLRHGSVSKFHGWFQVDEAGKFCIADAGSKNGIRVNDTALAARQLVRLQAGEPIKIGSVEAFICSADALWGALHSSATPARPTS